jgi:hypothetical protein
MTTEPTGTPVHSGQSATTADDAVHRMATRKAMLRLLPLMCAIYFMSYLDRTNVSLAKARLAAELGISAAA